MLFTTTKGKLQQIEETEFKNEKELQTFVENHLEELLGYTFLTTEFIIGRSRFDSLAYDEDSNAFVIVEYKNYENKGRIDQGYSYLAAILDRKADAVLLYNEKTGKQKKIDDFDWSLTRVIFISPEFTKYQLESTVFENLPFTLYELKRFGEFYQFTRINNTKKNLKIEKPFNNESEEEITKEIRVYSEDDIIPPEATFRETYEQLRDRILSLKEVTMEPKSSIVMKHNNRRFVIIEKANLKKFDVCINDPKGGIDDPFKLCKDIRSRAWGKLAWRIEVNEKSDLDKVMLLIKQSYEDVA